jgi:hypothetical protein
MQIRVLRLQIESDSYLNPRCAEKIRGYFGCLYRDNVLFHQHQEDGKLLYQYPRIQYKIIDGMPYLIGIEEGVEVLYKKFMEIKMLVLDDKEYEVFEKSISIDNVELGITDTQIEYRFLTPWYALNQENYKRYVKFGMKSKRMVLLKKILVGNILSICKSFGEVVVDEIMLENLDISEFRFNLDDIRILGFLGKFSVNFHIPDYLGIGKSVSRGFGTVVQETKHKTQQQFSF